MDAIMRYVGPDDEWHNARLTTTHPQSSHGIPVLVLDNGDALGPNDCIRYGRKLLAARDFVTWKRDVIMPESEVDFVGYSEEAYPDWPAMMSLVKSFVGPSPRGRMDILADLRAQHTD